MTAARHCSLTVQLSFIVLRGIGVAQRAADMFGLLGSGGAGVVRRAVGEHVVHVHLGPGLETAHHLVQ